RLRRFAERALGGLAILLLGERGEALHLRVESGEIAVTESARGLRRELVLQELVHRGVEARAVLGIAELELFGGDVVSQLADACERLALLEPACEVLPELLRLR